MTPDTPSLDAIVRALPERVLVALGHNLGATLRATALGVVGEAIELGRALTAAEVSLVVEAAQREWDRRTAQEAREGGR